LANTPGGFFGTNVNRLGGIDFGNQIESVGVGFWDKMDQLEGAKAKAHFRWLLGWLSVLGNSLISG